MDHIEAVNTVIGLITGIMSLVAALFSVLTYVKNRKQLRVQSQQIPVIVAGPGGRTWKCGWAIPRRLVSRAEVPGVLGLELAGGRFSMKALGSVAFMENLKAVQDGQLHEILVVCTPKEYDEFVLQAAVAQGRELPEATPELPEALKQMVKVELPKLDLLTR